MEKRMKIKPKPQGLARKQEAERRRSAEARADGPAVSVPVHENTPSTSAGAPTSVGVGAVERANETAPVGGENVRRDAKGELAEWMCGKKLRGERAGLLCRSPRMEASRTCRMHGSATRNARAKAHDRILMASDLAAKRLVQFMNSEDVPFNVRLSAAKDLLDRADLSGTSKHEIDIPKFVQDFEKSTFRFNRDLPEADDREVDKYSAVEAGTGDDIVDAEVVEPGQDPKPIEYQAPTRTPADYGAAEPYVSNDDTPPESVRRRMPNGAARTTEMRG